jgi:hypothetical protein
MSAILVLIVAAWTALIAVAIIVSCVQAIIHFLPSRADPWSLPLAPTLAELRNPV